MRWLFQLLEQVSDAVKDGNYFCLLLFRDPAPGFLWGLHGDSGSPVNAQEAVPKMHPAGAPGGRQMFLLGRANQYSSVGLVLGLVLVKGRKVFYHNRQDQRKISLP